MIAVNLRELTKVRLDAESARQSPTMTLLLGLPGAGKSSYAKKYLPSANYDLIVFDELRQVYGHDYHASTEPQVNALGLALARLALCKKHSVIIDESITTPGLAMDLASLAKEFGAKLRVIYLPTPVETCRLRRVPKYMPSADFERKLSGWQTWGKYILSLADSVEVVDADLLGEEA